MDSKSLLVFEYVAPEFHPAIEYLEAGDEVLVKLSADTRQSLNRPVSECLLVRFEDAVDWNETMHARVRCALAVEEAVLAVQGLVLGYKNIQPRIAVFDPRQGIFTAGSHRIPVGLIWARMRREAGVPGPAVKEVWQSILAVLREGKVSVSGIMVRKIGA